MIKLFRKIRQRLLAESRFSKYLLYALGEIILVVIGILIALQLNNWNAQNHANREEIKLLKELRANLENDLKDCLWNIDKQENLSLSNAAVLHHLEQRTAFGDSLRFHYGNLLYSTTQRRNMSAYEYLKSEGFNLIRNDSLRRNITAVYSERYYYIEKMEREYDNKIQLEQLLPLLNANIVYDVLEKSGYPVDPNQLYEDNAFIGVIRMNLSARKFMRDRYLNLSKDIKDLIAHIDAELRTRR